MSTLGDVTGVAALVVSVVSSGIAIAARRDSHRAAVAAEASANASAEGVIEQRRANDLAEAAQVEERRLADVYAVRWQWQYVAGQTWRLVNVGTDTAFDVKIVAPTIASPAMETVTAESVQHNESVELMIRQSNRLRRDCTVTWHRKGHHEETWSTSVPA
jgi:hypothetical protein